MKEREGPGPGLVLVPGLLCDAALFAPQMRALAPLPMHVADISGETDVDGMARGALAAVPFERFALLGLSLGGIVAMRMLDDPRITRLALLDTNHRPDTEGKRGERRALVREARERGLEPVVRERLKPAYLAPRHRHDRALNDVVVAMALRLGLDVFERQSEALIARDDASEALRGFTRSTLLLCGRHDRPCPPERHDEMAALLPNPHRITLPGAGHLTTLEAPAAVNAALRGWLFG